MLTLWPGSSLGGGLTWGSAQQCPSGTPMITAVGPSSDGLDTGESGLPVEYAAFVMMLLPNMFRYVWIRSASQAGLSGAVRPGRPAHCVRASADPARQSVAPPGRAGAERRSTQAAVARSTGSTQAAAAVRPGRVLPAEGRWTPGRSLICIRAAAAAVEGLQAAVRAQLPAARSAHRVGYRCETCARYP